MTAEPIDETPDAKVIPLRPGGSSDTPYEIHLDDEAEPVAAPLPVDTPPGDAIKRPIIPPSLRRGNRKTAAKRVAARTGYRVAVHAVRVVPVYTPLAVFWSVVGVFRLAGRQLRWWWLSEQHGLRQSAATDDRPDDWVKLHMQAKATRAWRGTVLAAELLAVIGVTMALVALAPWWLQAAAVVVAVLALAHVGHPPDKPILRPAVVMPRHRVLSADIVLRAYYAAKLGDPDKLGQQVTFASQMGRDSLDQGSQVVVDLPYGKTFADVVKAKASIASGMDVTEQQVFLARDRTSTRRHTLFVADRDPLAIPAGPTPLLDCKPRDIWRAFFMGLDERGRKVLLDLLWISILIGSQPRKGKALALDTLVPTPSGWTTMGELRSGDQVFDETGQPCRVVMAHEVRYDRRCYEVRFSDGSVIVADAEHLWQVDTRASRLSAQQRAINVRISASPFSHDQSHRWALPQVLTTADMLGSVRIQADKRANYSVRVAAPLQAETADLLVPPYTLGAWLGDGTSIHGAITCADAEIISRIEQEGERTGLNPSSVKDGGCPYYRVYGLLPRLRQIGVLGNKHIPTAYLRASETQRRALLAGLLDTDGYCQRGTGVVYFSGTNERLVRNVRHLVSTLGYKSSLNVKPARLNGRDYGWQWVVTFTPADKVFGLVRKSARQVTTMKASAGHRFITEIRQVPSVPVRCITVDSPSSLYLVGETCIPTHNTFFARLTALYGALDPYVKLTVADGKGGQGSPDWVDFALVAHRYIRGTAPSRHGDPVAQLIDALREILRHIDKTNEILAHLPVDVCPEGKLTRELHRDPRYPDLHVWLLVLEEFQNYFETEDQDANKEIAWLLSRIQAIGPSSGVILLSSSQKPAGVGAGTEVQRLFNRFRDNHVVRFALRCGNRDVSMAILGGDAYQEGYDASALPVGVEYRGVGILYGASDDTPTVRTHLADREDARKILLAARTHRERAGTLSGNAAGEEVARLVRDVLADVRAMFRPGEAWVSWQQLAARLADQMPEHYADTTAEAISAQVRAFGVESRSGKQDGQVLRGAKRGEIEQAAQRREATR